MMWICLVATRAMLSLPKALSNPDVNTVKKKIHACVLSKNTRGTAKIKEKQPDAGSAQLCSVQKCMCEPGKMFWHESAIFLELHSKNT